VRDDAGQVLAGIRVEAARVLDSRFWDPIFSIEGQSPSGVDGHFVLRDLPAGDYRLRARSPEHRPEEIDGLELAPGGALDIVIELRTGLALEGRVVDATGRPIAGAEVSSSKPPARAGPIYVGMFPDPLAWASDEFRTTTDTDGRFRIGRLVSGNRRMVVRHDAGATAVVESIASGSSDVIIRMTSGARVDGRIIDAASQPIADARVTVRPLSERFPPDRMYTGDTLKSDA
jgi:hypothetical protein